MNFHILDMIKSKHKLFKRYLNYETPENLSAYKTKSNKIKKEVEKAKKQYYFNLFKKCKNDPKKNWKEINSLMKKNKNAKANLPKVMSFERGGKASTDPKSILNKLISTFVSKGPKLAAKLPKSNLSFLKHMRQRISTPMSFSVITEDDIVKIICKLDSNKASGYDGISATVLKWCAPYIVAPLASIFNALIKMGSYPAIFKVE